MRTKLLCSVFTGCLIAVAAVAADDPPAKAPKGWTEYIPESKAFGVWLPEGGRRSERTREATFSGAKLKISMVVVEKDKAIYRAEQVSLPVKAGQKVDTAAALEVFRDAFVKDVDGLVTADSDIKLGKMAGKEYVMDAGKSKQAKLRIYVTGPRVYMISMIGSKEQLEGESAKIYFDSFKHQGMVKDELKGKETTPGTVANRGPRTVGGDGDKEFGDKAPEGGYLVGMEVGLGKFGKNDVIRALRPVFRVGDKESTGTQFGTELSRVVKVVAKPGYAVGALTVKAGLTADGFSITFMKVVDGKLDPKDAYESEWIGGKGGRAPVKVGGDGTPVIGLLVRASDKDATGLGLSYFGEKVAQGKPTPILGGGNDSEFKESADGNGLLAGLEVGLGKAGGNDVVRAVRPVFRDGGKDTLGDQQGTELARVVKVVAKEGYAVGALTVKAGLGVDGLSVTFMKVVDGKLDPKDAYESEWVGGKGGGEPVKLGGDGTAVVGIAGKANRKDVTGLGLLLKEAKK